MSFGFLRLLVVLPAIWSSFSRYHNIFNIYNYHILLVLFIVICCFISSYFKVDYAELLLYFPNVFIILDDKFEKFTRHVLYFFILDIPVCEAISRTIWRFLVSIPFAGNFIFASLKLWKLYHSFLFLLNISILLQVFI